MRSSTFQDILRLMLAQDVVDSNHMVGGISAHCAFAIHLLRHFGHAPMPGKREIIWLDGALA
jgi:hypothetical protein